jgi:hypothetical protein
VATTKKMCLFISSSHLFFFALEYGCRQARICAYVDMRPNCFSLCVCYEQSTLHHHHYHHYSASFVFSMRLSTSYCLKQIFEKEKTEFSIIIYLFYFASITQFSGASYNPFLLAYLHWSIISDWDVWSR